MDEGITYFEFGYTSNEHLVSPDSADILYELTRKAEKKDILTEKDIMLPACIFREGHSALRAIVKYLKEQKNLNFSEIANLLLRDKRTIWATYDSVKKARACRQETLWSETEFVPIKIIRNRNLSVLEAISTYLRKYHSLKEVSGILGKNSKTIWTVLERAKIKKRRRSA